MKFYSVKTKMKQRYLHKSAAACACATASACGTDPGEVLSVLGQQLGEDGLPLKPLLLLIHIAIHEACRKEYSTVACLVVVA